MATVYERYYTVTMPGVNDLRIRRERDQALEALIQLEAYLTSQTPRIHGSPETARKKMLEILRTGKPDTLTTTDF